MNAKSSLCTISEDEINWERQNSIFKAQRGYNKVLTAGERRNAIKNAKNALSMGLTPEQAAQITFLPLEQVLDLKTKESSENVAVQI